MSKNNVMIYEAMRPPVASHNGETPLRGRKANRLFDLANGDFEDRSGFKITKEQVIQNYTDDARIADNKWNNRHHVCPSAFNSTNHKYYKQLFDKDSKNKQNVMIYPQRQLDPYDENEVKGTRMPDYSKLAKERDIYGELGWIQNFNVKFSKNNSKLHKDYREFFDGPKNYHNQFNNSTLTNSEFFRQNAPQGSVARLPNKMSQTHFAGAGNSTYKPHQRSGSMYETQSKFGGSVYATPFILENDKSNKHRVVAEVEKTMQNQGQIPFLRSQVDPRSFSKTHHGTFMGAYMDRSYSQQAQQARKIRVSKKRESGWNSYIKPISKYNEQVHPSMKIPFEQI